MMSRVWTIARRELGSYFDHATAYILLVVFLVFNFFFFYRDAYALDEASLRPMMSLLPWVLLFLVPAVCMRALAEERRAGTLELVLAQPIGALEFLAGKFLGVYLFLLIAMAGTLGVPIGLSWGADLQVGVMVAQYVGSAFLIAAMVAIGLWASSLTQNQVTAFILGVTITFGLYVIGFPVVVLGLPSWLSVIAVRLGILGHFENVARGVIDLRDVLYFLAVTAAFLALTYFSIMRERLSRGREGYRRLRWGTAGIVAAAVFAALAGAQLRGRIDLTPGKVYTLSEPTRDLLGGLDDLVTIKFFRTEEVPPEFSHLRRDVEDLLRDFDAAGGGNVNLVQLDPADDEEVEREASTLRIEPVRFNVVSEGGATTREGYLGVAVEYAGQSDVIPLVARTSDLEYRLASMMRSLTRERRPVVALLTGHGELDPRSGMTLVAGRLGEEYAVEEFRMDSTTVAVPDSFAVVVIAGFETPLELEAAELLAEYLDRGGKLFVAASGMSVDTRSGFAGPAFNAALDSLLQSRGLGIERALAYDLQAHEPIQMQSGIGGVILSYPLFLYAQPASDHVVVNGVSPLPYRWGSPLRIEADSTLVTPLLATTDLGGRLAGPVSIDPGQEWRDIIRPDEVGTETLAVAYADSAGGRIVLAGSSSFLDDETVSRSQAGLAGVIFFQNAIDWLAEDEALITIRSKDRSPPQLLLEELPRSVARYANLVGVPLLFVLFGLFRGARRRALQRREYEAGGALA